MRRRRILFVVLVARIENARKLEYVMFRELVGGASCVGGEEKWWIGCLVDDLRAFGSNTDQWTIAD